MNKKSFLILILSLLLIVLTSCNSGHIHNYGEWNIIKEATCLEVGVKQRSCECGETETDFISKLNHNVVVDEAVFPTCLTDGKSYGKHCSLCNTVLEEQVVISASGHYFDEKWEYVDEDKCGRVCLRCGEYDLCAHESSGEATTDKSEICVVCGYIINPMLNHTTHTNSNEWGYNSTHHWYKCEGCEAKKYDFAEHNLSEYEVELDATKESEGVMTATCLDGCGYVSIKKILRTPIFQREDEMSFSWNMVENATGYYLYDGDEFISDLGNVLTYTSAVNVKVFEYNLVAYTTDPSYFVTSNHSNSIKIGFEADIQNMQEGYGTDFDGYSPTLNSGLFKPVGGTISSGWKTDSNGVKAFGIQANYQAVTLTLDPDDSTNPVLRVQGGKEVTRVALNVNNEIVEIGSYKLSLKIRLGTADATSIGRILLRVNKKNDISASGAISDSIFFIESDDADSVLSASEWRTFETIFTVTEELYENLFYQDVCLVFIVYTYNDSNGLESAVNHILIDDLEMYKVNVIDPDHQHNYIWNELKESSCKEIGLKAHYSCEGCGKYFDENKTHVTYKSLVIDKLSHNYSYTVIKEATTTEEGIYERTCLGECKETRTVQVLRTPVVDYKHPYLMWTEVDNAEGYKLYKDNEFVCDLGDVSQYMLPLEIGNSLYHVEAYTNNEDYYKFSLKSEALELEVEQSQKNLQGSCGTDFEGYNTVNHASLFNSSSSFVGTSSGLWQSDGNGVNAFGFQKDFNAIRLVEELDGNIALKVAGKGKSSTNGYLVRVGLNVNDDVINPGTYKATIKVKAGPKADNIGSILFRLYDTDNITGDYYVYNQAMYFRNIIDNPAALSKDEWTTLELEFNITADLIKSNYSKDKDLVAVFIVYTNNSANNAENYLLVDDFEIYKIKPIDPNHEHNYVWTDTKPATEENKGLKGHYYCEGCETYFDEDKKEVSYNELIIAKIPKNIQKGLGTDFEGYNTTDHASLFDSSSSFTGIKGGLWQTDANGANAFGFQTDFNAMRLVEEQDGNIALKVAGKGKSSNGKYLVRVGIDVNDAVINPGTYKATIKVKAGPEADNIGNIFFRLFDTDDITSSNYVYDSTMYFRNTENNPAALSKDEWTTLEVEFTITSDLIKSNYSKDENLVAVLYAYTNNSANNSNNYLLVDDFEIYKLS